MAQGASCVLASDYGTTSWLMFYLPKGTCVVQRRERYRWTYMPEPDAGLLKGRLLLVGYPDGDGDPDSQGGRIQCRRQQRHNRRRRWNDFAMVGRFAQ